jgi:hypothetical protein
MKSLLVILFVAVVLVAVGTLAVMNNACKSGQHAWCAPTSAVRNHIRPSPRPLQTSGRSTLVFWINLCFPRSRFHPRYILA